MKANRLLDGGKMHRISRRSLLAVAASALATRALAQHTQFMGDWHGALDVGSTRLRLKFVIEPGPRATLYSLDQGSASIAAAETEIDGDRINMRFPTITARFEGRLVDGRIDGQFTQGATLPLALGRAPIAGPPPPAPPPKAEPLTRERLAAFRTQVGSPGIAAAAASRSGRSVSLADGVRALGQAQAVTTADQWHIGSITKSMTSTLVARAVEQGAVSWDDAVGDVLAQSVPSMRDEYRRVTYRHLLSHRSGLPANIDVSALLKFPRHNDDPREDRLAYAHLALSQAPVGPAEKTFTYSNSGYVVAASMLETRMGAKWETLVRDHVFAPLGMASAGQGAPGVAGRYGQPVGHALGQGGGLSPFPVDGEITDNPAVLGPAGRVHVAFVDMLKYLVAHRDRTSLLRSESWDILHTPPFGGDYAMGWMRRGDALWHNGSNTLWYAEVICAPRRGIVAIAAVNDGRMGLVAPTIGSVLQSAVLAVA